MLSPFRRQSLIYRQFGDRIEFYRPVGTKLQCSHYKSLTPEIRGRSHLMVLIKVNPKNKKSKKTQKISDRSSKSISSMLPEKHDSNQESF